jgi:hypothetical protein
MGFIDDLMNATIESISKAATNAFSTEVISYQDNTKINNIKTELTAINGELDDAYRQIGKKFVEYVSETNEMPGIDVKDILKLMEPKLEKKNEIESELIEIEKKIKEQTITQEKEKFENEFKRQKDTLDKAKDMDIISKDEYDLKLKQYTKKRNNFQAIRNVKKQYEFGIISYEELQMKLRELT